METQPMQCCLCSGTIEAERHPDTGVALRRSGHNAQPVADGRCCDTCHMVIVVPTRIYQIKAKARQEAQR